MSSIYYNFTQSTNIVKEDLLISITFMKTLFFFQDGRSLCFFLYKTCFCVFQYDIIKFLSIITWHNMFYAFQFISSTRNCETLEIYNLIMRMTRWKLCKTPIKDFNMINWIMRNKIEMVVNCKPPIKFYDVYKVIDNLKSKMKWVS